jgi:hypothetical protein
VEFEATKCCLQLFNSNKVIVEIVQKRRLCKFIGFFQSLVAKCNTKMKGMTFGIKALDMFHCKF